MFLSRHKGRNIAKSTLKREYKMKIGGRIVVGLLTSVKISCKMIATKIVLKWNKHRNTHMEQYKNFGSVPMCA